MIADEKRWEDESNARALVRAEVIKKDSKLYARAKKVAKKMAKEKEKEVNALKRIGKIDVNTKKNRKK